MTAAPPTAGALPILTFHALELGREPICFPPALFKLAMERLIGDGWRGLSLEEGVRCLAGGGPWPARSFAVTFDDGYRSVHREAFPVLSRLGIPATVFLTVGPLGAARTDGGLPAQEGREMLRWDEIGEMSEAGIGFGAHTLTHPDLTRLPLERARAEIREPRTIIEERLGRPVTSFAYPGGWNNPAVRAMVAEHYDCALTVRLGRVGPGSDRHALERVDAYYLRSERRFRLIESPLFPAYLGALGFARRVRSAVWGGAA